MNGPPHNLRGGATSHGRGRGRGLGFGRGDGRGRGRGQGRGGSFNPSSSNVPTTQQVIPGANVSMVLKEDQGTGREVEGIVKDILTSGNHPRGIKVRLMNGNVGRVQRMVSNVEEERRAMRIAVANGHEGSSLGNSGEAVMGMNEGLAPPRAGNGSVGGSGMMVSPNAGLKGGTIQVKYSDYRVDSPDEPPETEASLLDYIVVKQPKKKNKGKGKKNLGESAGGDAGVAPEPEVTVKCPLCGEFEGDAAAVAHHVGTEHD